MRFGLQSVSLFQKDIAPVIISTMWNLPNHIGRDCFNHFQIGILIPLVFFEVFWWLLAFRWRGWDEYNYFALFAENNRYIMSITMMVGAMIAGMTSEGGGAVAFPVMTLALGIKPAVARDFSLMIQVQQNADQIPFNICFS